MEVHVVTEIDDGWDRVEDRYYFPTRKKAMAFVVEYNEKHKERNTRSWGVCIKNIISIM